MTDTAAYDLDPIDWSDIEQLPPDSGMNPFDEGTPEAEAWARLEAAELDERMAAALDARPEPGPESGDFWHSRKVLQHVHDFARARRAAPWATLAVVLARAITAVPPYVVLPAIVGGQASLNSYYALVGPSGAGKGAAMAAAADALDLPDVDTAGLGSGEGIAHLFMSRTRKGLEQHATAALLEVAEIDTLAALGGRSGSTLLPELRKAWSGERLGFSYADPAKRLPVAAHKYRLCLVAGVQPGRAGGLLEDSDGGTPQRFVWLPATDPAAPDVAPEEPEPWVWQHPAYPLADFRTGRVPMDVCAPARQAITAARLAALRGHAATLDGHALLARLKVAASLAVLDGRADVREEDWHLAEVVARVSDRTRDAIVEALRRAENERNVKRGQAEGDRAVIAAERLEDAAVKRVARWINRKLGEARDWVNHADLRRAMAGRDRPYFDAAIERLADSGSIEIEPVGDDGRRYRVAAGATS